MILNVDPNAVEGGESRILERVDPRDLPIYEKCLIWSSGGNIPGVSPLPEAECEDFLATAENVEVTSRPVEMLPSASHNGVYSQSLFALLALLVVVAIWYFWSSRKK